MHWFEVFLFILGGCFLFSGIDDLFIDLVHLFGRIQFDQWSEDEWKSVDRLPEQNIAVMVPAWREHDVIVPMIRTNTQRIEYENYRWFIGVYPNDPETLELCRDLAIEYPNRVNVVIVDRPGPSSKAHCLNNIFQSICAEANRTAWEPDLIALHDAEDVVHPESFKVINAMPVETEFFQIPIFSLDTPLRSLVSGTYMDEFAENHLKEIPARQSLGLPIPSAGVGTFVRFATLLRAQVYFGYAFNETTLTEDYDLSMRLAYLGATQQFVTVRTRDQKYLVATHAYFPHRFRASIRQKTRWIIGITLQGVKFIRPITLPRLYGRLRDRKGLLTNPINLFGWIGFLTGVVFFFRHQLPAIRHPHLLEKIFFVNFLILLIRVVQRFRFTFKTYGLFHAMLGVFRILLVNFINMAATFRAIYQYNRSNPLSPSQKRPIKWDKTDHRFPDASRLPGPTPPGVSP